MPKLGKEELALQCVTGSRYTGFIMPTSKVIPKSCKMGEVICRERKFTCGGKKKKKKVKQN